MKWAQGFYILTSWNAVCQNISFKQKILVNCTHYTCQMQTKNDDLFSSVIFKSYYRFVVDKIRVSLNTLFFLVYPYKQYFLRENNILYIFFEGNNILYYPCLFQLQRRCDSKFYAYFDIFCMTTTLSLAKL